MKVPVLFLFISILSVGNAHAIDTYLSCSDQARGTASFWEGCPESVRTELEAIYAGALKSQTRFSEDNSLIPGSGVTFLERLRSGDSHARILKQQLGYQEKLELDGKGNSVQMLLPPSSVELFFTTAVNAIRKLPGPHLLPAVSFVKKATGLKALSEKISHDDIIFVTPGVDPWPSEDWVLAESVKIQISHGIWRQSIARLRMPFSLKMLKHDIGHLSELLEQGMMVEMLHYYRDTIAGAAPDFILKVDKSPLNFDQPDAHHFWRLASLTESFSLPSAAASHALDQALGKRVLVQGAILPSVESHANSLMSEFSKAKLLQVASWITENQDLLFLKMGGGTRDGGNLPYHLESSNITTKIQQTAQGKQALVQDTFPPAVVPTLIVETLFGISAQIDLLSKCQESVEHAGCARLKESGIDFYSEMVKGIARIQLAAAARDLEDLTPAKALRQGTQLVAGQKNSLKNYIQAFAPKTSFLYFVFVGHFP